MKALLSEGRYYGRCNTLRNAGTLILTECDYSPGLKIVRHAHENPYFIFVLGGSQDELFGNRRRKYVSGTVAFHPSGEAHSQQIGSLGLRCLHVEFNKKWIERHSEISRFLEDGSEFQGGRIGWLAQRIHREFNCTDDVAAAAIEGLVLETLAESSRLRKHDSSDKRPKWLQQARDLIHARFRESLSLSEVAAGVDVHPIRLSRAFRTHHRCSVGEFIRQVRIEAACEAIKLGSVSLSEVALASGFADQAHFSRTFKRVTGMTPTQFLV